MEKRSGFTILGRDDPIGCLRQVIDYAAVGLGRLRKNKGINVQPFKYRFKHGKIGVPSVPFKVGI